LRGKDLADGRYGDSINARDMADAAGLSRSHFSREFKRAFGESPNQYLLNRRLERAAHLLRHTDWRVSEICLSVGLRSVGSFTTSFSKTFGVSPTEYRRMHPPARAHVMVPGCITRLYGRMALSTNQEADAPDPA
jgi:AraC-like DNA-binding protein